MADMTMIHNIGAVVDLVRLSDHFTATAAGAGDNTLQTGNTIDRMSFSTGALARSGLFGAVYEATLGSGKTLSVAYDIQNSPDGTNWTDYQSGASVAVATGAAGGSTVKGSYNVQVDLSGAMRYVRFNTTLDLSATGTDTQYYDCVGVLGGWDFVPSPN